MLTVHSSHRDLKYFLFDKISGTNDFDFYGKIFVNLYRLNPVSVVEAMDKGNALGTHMRRYFGGALTKSSSNAV